MVKVVEVASKALLMRLRSRKELGDYLRKKGFEKSEIEEALDELESCGYLSDRIFCEEYMRYAFKKKWGRERVFRELKLKGVAANIIEDSYENFLQENEDDSVNGSEIFHDFVITDEYERAVAAARKVVFDSDELNEKMKGRVARRLASYGYSSDIIYRVLGELSNEIQNR